MDPCEHTESLALFALALYLQRNGYAVQEKGDLQKVNQPNRRHLISRAKEQPLHTGREGEMRNGIAWAA